MTMKKRPSSYARYFALAAKMSGDRKMIRETLVSRFTNGRTTSLREMWDDEYEQMCRAIEAEQKHGGLSEEEYRRELKAARSAVLHRLQKYGVDTLKWSYVDAFCEDPRIAGKKFAALSLEELRALVPKLEAMFRKPRRHSTVPCQTTIPIFFNTNVLPS